MVYPDRSGISDQSSHIGAFGIALDSSELQSVGSNAFLQLQPASIPCAAVDWPVPNQPSKDRFLLHVAIPSGRHLLTFPFPPLVPYQI